MKNFVRAALLILMLGMGGVSWAGPAARVAAFETMARIHGFEAEPELQGLVTAFETLPERPDQVTVKSLFEEQHIASWSGRIAEYLGLCDILFESLSPHEQKGYLKDFASARETLGNFQRDITQYVLAIHPGFAPLQLDELKKRSKGQGIRVVVFDVFEESLLDEQRQRYPEARIHKTQAFGRPVALSHGNTVIDIILQLAPAVEIFPVAADARSYATAMAYLSEQETIDIINMSRAFPEDPVTHTVDAEFQKALRRWTREGIFVKALGNTGSDLFGQLTRPRVEKGLGPVNSLTSYDLKLIRELYQESSPIGLEVFALNLGLFADELALTATIPGDWLPVQERTLAVPADGIYSPSTDTFESGSSFAAPQISACLALLLAERRAMRPGENLVEARAQVYQDLLQSGNKHGRPANEWGRGMPMFSSSSLVNREANIH